MTSPAATPAPCDCARSPMGMVELAKRLGLQTPQGARTFVRRHGIPHLRRGRTLVVLRATWGELVELAEDAGGDWSEAVRRLKRRRREARAK